jgi:hypothetical protein
MKARQMEIDNPAHGVEPFFCGESATVSERLNQRYPILFPQKDSYPFLLFFFGVHYVCS